MANPHTTPAPIPHGSYEPRPDPHSMTSNPDPSKNSSSGVDYEPHPSSSVKISPEHEKIVKAITNLYSGSASEEDMQVYAAESVYDDPWSFCDTRYKIAGQWYGIPKLMASSKTLAIEIVSDKPSEIIFKLQQEYTPRVLHFSKPVNSLITLTLDKEGKVKYHKDQWNEKDYSHEGLGKVMKTLNGDHLTKITRPPEDLHNLPPPNEITSSPPAAPSKMQILVIGSMNTDLVTRTSRMPQAGETLTSQSFETGYGGKGANQAVACVRLSHHRDAKKPTDIEVKMVGAVGDDNYGHEIIKSLTKDGINCSGVQLAKELKTGTAVIIVEEKTGENRILLSPGANHSLRPRFWGQEEYPEFLKADVLVLQLEIPQETVKSIVANTNAQVVFNPAPAPDIPLRLEDYTHIEHLIINETETSMISGFSIDYINDEENLPTVAASLHEKGQIWNIIITRGSKGVFYSTVGKQRYDGNERFHGSVKAEEVNVVDTTAAGDTFVGAYAVEVANSVGGKFDLREAVVKANKAAAKTVEKEGAQSAIPWLDEMSWS
ncbi:MAG: hypothetical protein M1836_000765 [Candelina mexicana]|nr:MAG: hypothetical protein M1836_000765 [Candelina mexicana]